MKKTNGLKIRGKYTWFVPFFDMGSAIKLITAYPSRKAHKKYGGKFK
jgi:hypothetical protein